MFSLLTGGLIPLHNASSFGHTEVVSLLLNHGADPNARDNWNFTPLHEAAIKGKVDVCIGECRGWSAVLLELLSLCGGRGWRMQIEYQGIAMFVEKFVEVVMTSCCRVCAWYCWWS